MHLTFVQNNFSCSSCGRCSDLKHAAGFSGVRQLLPKQSELSPILYAKVIQLMYGRSNARGNVLYVSGASIGIYHAHMIESENEHQKTKHLQGEGLSWDRLFPRGFLLIDHS